MVQVVYKRHSRARPEAIGWAAACVSLVIVPIGTWWAVWRSEHAVEAVAARAVIESLAQGDSATAEKALGEALNRPKYERWLRGDLSGIDPERVYAVERVALLMLQMLRGVIEGRPDNAANAFQNIDPNLLEELLARSADSDSGLDLLEGMQSNFKSWQETAKQLTQAKRDRQGGQQELEKLRERFRRLQAEFASLLSVRNTGSIPARLADAVYSSGVLKGVPIIADVPGTAANLVELKAGLDRIGGRVRTTSDNPHTEFLSRVESAQGSAESMIELEQRLHDQINSVQQTILRLDRTHSQTTTVLRRDLRLVVERLIVKVS